MKCHCLFGVVSFVGSMLTGLSMGLSHDLSVKAGLKAAHLSLQSRAAVSPELDPALLQPERIRQWAQWDAEAVSI